MIRASSFQDFLFSMSYINIGLFHVKWCKPGHDPSQDLIKICQAVTLYKIDNPENFSLISCTD